MRHVYKVRKRELTLRGGEIRCELCGYSFKLGERVLAKRSSKHTHYYCQACSIEREIATLQEFMI